MFIKNIDEIHESWIGFLDEKIIRELKHIEREIGNNYYPTKENVLRFLNQDLNKVKYIIVGMDPYPTEYEKDGKFYPIATGRSFEVGNYNSWMESTKNKSLTNILKAIYIANTNDSKSNIKEIREKIGTKEFDILEPNQLFDDLEEQGVLFLNYALTVEPHKPGSHTHLWENFTISLRDYIIKNNPNVIWILWGKDANEKLGRGISSKNILSNCHPRLNEFLENNNFAQMNDIDLKGRGK